MDIDLELTISLARKAQLMDELKAVEAKIGQIIAVKQYAEQAKKAAEAPEGGE